MTLRGGLKAGNFTDVGKVDDMVICTKLCCVAEKCDLAMMINRSCFLVSCYTMQLCQVVKAISNTYQPSVAYVMRRTGELQEETGNYIVIICIGMSTRYFIRNWFIRNDYKQWCRSKPIARVALLIARGGSFLACIFIRNFETIGK